MNKEKIEKAIKSLEKQKEIHKENVRRGSRNYALLEYWEREIRAFENEIQRLKEKLEEK